jgi:hypothetical protein
MHEECLIDEILAKTYERAMEDGSEEADINGAAEPAADIRNFGRKIWRGKFKATLHSDVGVEGTHATVTITDTRTKSKGPKSRTERVACLRCGSLLD